MGKRLRGLQKKAFLQILELMKKMTPDQIPKQVLDECAKHGIYLEEGEDMVHFTEKLTKHVKEVEKTI